MQKPKIAVIPLWDDERESLWMVPGYMDGVCRAGGIPIILHLADDMDDIWQLARDFDGFLFTGGQDVSPHIYGQENMWCGSFCSRRDSMEQRILEEAVLMLDKPAFGICRGLQLLNASLGGTLFQDIPRQLGNIVSHVQKPPYSKPVHSVKILPGTPLSEIVGVDKLMVNSYHHQGIHRMSEQLQPMAEAEDGLVEAVYMPGRRFAMAVQWHPEFALEDRASQRLFAAFVEACKKR